MSENSDVEKTEEPTPQRKEKARDDGQVLRSRELSSFLMMFSGGAFFWIGGDYLIDQLWIVLAENLVFQREILVHSDLLPQKIKHGLEHTMKGLLPIVGGLMIIAFIGPALYGGISLPKKPLKFDLKKLNPLSGLKRMFSQNMLAELFKNILKVSLVLTALYFIIIYNFSAINQLVTRPLQLALSSGFSMVLLMVFMVIFITVPMIGFDVYNQFRTHMKKLRMSKQEIKDEYKQSEGDPQIKARLRQQQKEMSRRRMMSNISQADVIVTNPTHYAVALQYDRQKMKAPKVLAKGRGLMAINIKQRAAEHQIPVLEAPPLARALYRHSEIDQVIPTELYAAVAEVLAWIYQLKHWKRRGGLKPQQPINLPVPRALDFAEEKNTHG